MTIGSATNVHCPGGGRIVAVGLTAIWIVASVWLAGGVRPLIPAAAASVPSLRHAAPQRIRTGVLNAAESNDMAGRADPGGLASEQSVVFAPSGAPATGSPWRRRLSGIILSPQLHEALFEQDGETQVLREGEQLDGWTLAAVGAGQVTLRSSAAEEIVALDARPGEDASASWRIEGDQRGQAARAVEAASSRQAAEQAMAETQLARATRRMTRH
jgi:hypothetical protein